MESLGYVHSYITLREKPHEHIRYRENYSGSRGFHSSAMIILKACKFNDGRVKRSTMEILSSHWPDSFSL